MCASWTPTCPRPAAPASCMTASPSRCLTAAWPSISISYAKQNVKVVGTDPGISAELNGGTHMSMEDIGVLRSVPGVVIFEPVDEVQLRAAMPVLNEYYGCVYVRLFRKQLPTVFGEGYKFDLFKADTLREGKDLSIFVSGFLTKDALEVADQLAAEGISCDVINVHTIKPIDKETVLASARKTGQRHRRPAFRRAGSAGRGEDPRLRRRRAGSLRRGRQDALSAQGHGPDRGGHGGRREEGRLSEIRRKQSNGLPPTGGKAIL